MALVLARPEITSLSDLNNKNIAIEEKQSAASGSVSAALMAAGAAEVQFSEGKAGAIDRLISGEVPAAVLTLASREAAEWFPDIAGFRTFRVPLSLRARALANIARVNESTCLSAHIAALIRLLASSYRESPGNASSI